MDHRAKLEWARRHLDTFDGEINAWLKQGPFTTRVEVDRKAKRIRILVDAHLPMPGHWSLMVGDIVHNMRSSLDHLTYELSMRGTTLPNKSEVRQIQFPICVKHGEYWGLKKDDGQRARRIKFVSPAAQAEIDGLQPYHRVNSAESHLLAVLGGLSNVDKHRHILVTAVLGAVPRFSVKGLGGPLSEKASITNITRSLEQGAVLTVIQFADALPESDVRVDPYLAGNVAFDEKGPGRGALVWNTLEGTHDFIRDDVFPKLEPFL